MTRKANRKQGTVQSYNVSPKGFYEGLLLQSEDQVVQVNFGPEEGSGVEGWAPIGTVVELEVEPGDTRDASVHEVYRLSRVPARNGDGKQGSHGKPDGQFAGTVKQLNYALHGEVNGAILDNGDFLHLKPHGAAAVGLTVGMKVSGKGHSKPMMGGHRVLEAEQVNGIDIEHKPKPKKKPAH
jgi:hypothetical protein